MPANGVLSWNNESSVTPYPLSKSIGADNLLVDANFVQFDAFQPVLTKLQVIDDSFILEIQFDKVLKTITISKFDLTGVTYPVSIYDNTRYLGKLVLGAEAMSLYDELANKTFTPNVKFLPNTVKSIPSKAGVYTVHGFAGAVEVISDAHIYYDTSMQNVTFNAVSVPTENPEAYLKTLNSVGPIDNNVFIKDSDTIKITLNGTSNIQLSLVGSGIANLVVEQNSTIPTNPNPS